MLHGINGAANRVNGGDLLDWGVNVDDDVDLSTLCCCEVAGLWRVTVGLGYLKFVIRFLIVRNPKSSYLVS
ncbi:hypothetical protein V6N11_016771 [Hibiscus sabdariffa]|uniref:Uncharacterized protein n=1 Tax=Hibiscus sabdariffa TaxID=183260 RepID=A0ABR2TVZ1_9ROSI